MNLKVPKESENPLLYKTSKELTLAEIKSPEIKKFTRDLIETMYHKNGVGIASVQVAKHIQLCVIAKDFTPDKKTDLVLINPSFEKASVLRDWDEEGCLSVPKVYGKVRRYKKINVRALDDQGNPVAFLATGFFARICQHEIDHLNGILFIAKAKQLHTLEENSK